MIMLKTKHNLTGRQFGLLTVLEQNKKPLPAKRATKKATWICKCECGNTKIAYTDQLLCGRTKSCGCYRKAVFKKVKERASCEAAC